MYKFLWWILVSWVAVQSQDTSFAPRILILDSISVESQGVFADSKAHTQWERQFYNFLENLHSKTKPDLIQSLCPIHKGDTLNPSLLAEAERTLRGQPFLSGAQIHLDTTGNKNTLKIRAQDKWSLNPLFSLSHPAETWDFAAGIYEYNLLGKGIQTGFSYIDIKDKTGWQGLFGTPHFLIPNQRLDLLYYTHNEGYSAYINIQRALSTLNQHWSWGLSYSGQKENEKIFLANNLYPRIQKPNFHTARLYPSPDQAYQIATRIGSTQDSSLLYLSYNQKWGVGYLQTTLKNEWLRKMDSDSLYYTAYQNTDKQNYYLKNLVPDFHERHELWQGIVWQYQIPRLYKLANFHKLKQVEDVDLGAKIATGFYLDPWDSWTNRRFKWTQGLELGYAWGESLLGLLGAKNSFEPYATPYQDGKMRVSNESQWTILRDHSPQDHLRNRLSLVWNSELNSLWSAHPGDYITMGAYEGIIGTLNNAFAGQSIAYSQMELRYFPGVNQEFGTLVPAFAAFINTAGGWDQMEKIRTEDLSYRFGLGIRLGTSKAYQGVINHFNVSWPLYHNQNKSWALGITAKLDL